MVFWYFLWHFIWLMRILCTYSLICILISLMTLFTHKDLVHVNFSKTKKMTGTRTGCRMLRFCGPSLFYRLLHTDYLPGSQPGGSPRLIIKVPVSSSHHKIRSNSVWFGCLHKFHNSKIHDRDLDSWFTKIKKAFY